MLLSICPLVKRTVLLCALAETCMVLVLRCSGQWEVTALGYDVFLADGMSVGVSKAKGGTRIPQPMSHLAD